MPLARRVPKRGFVNGAFKKDFAIVNLDVARGLLRGRRRRSTRPPSGPAGLVKGRHDDGVKILGDGELTKALTVHAAEVQRVGRRQDRRRRRHGRRRLIDGSGRPSAIRGRPGVRSVRRPDAILSSFRRPDR